MPIFCKNILLTSIFCLCLTALFFISLAKVIWSFFLINPKYSGCSAFLMNSNLDQVDRAPPTTSALFLNFRWSKIVFVPTLFEVLELLRAQKTIKHWKRLTTMLTAVALYAVSLIAGGPWSLRGGTVRFTPLFTRCHPSRRPDVCRCHGSATISFSSLLSFIFACVTVC